jgi:hypothetical protein
MDPQKISPGAQSDISRLTKGEDRADVALDALQDCDLTPTQIRKLTRLLRSEQIKQSRVLPRLVDGKEIVTVDEALRPRLEMPRDAEQFKFPEITPVGRLQKSTVDGHIAVSGKVAIGSWVFNTLLSEGSFGKTVEEQRAYAERFGYQLVSPEVHRVYVETLIRNSRHGSAADSYALEIYRQRYVRGWERGFSVELVEDLSGGHLDLNPVKPEPFPDLGFGLGSKTAGALFISRESSERYRRERT